MANNSSEDEYDVVVYLRVRLRHNSLVVHDPGAVAASAKHHVAQRLSPTQFLKNGVMYLTNTIEVTARNVKEVSNDT
jgi:hypothetical protein